MQFDRIAKKLKKKRFCNGKGQMILIIIRAIIWIMRLGEFCSQSLLLGTSFFLSCLPVAGSGGGMLHMGSCCGLVVSCFTILPKISFSRGWHDGLIILKRGRSFSVFTFYSLWSHFFEGHSCYHKINPRVLFFTVWLLLCSSTCAWEIIWPTGLRAGNSRFWKALNLWPWHHY